MADLIFFQPQYVGDSIVLTLNFFQSDGVTPQNMTGNQVGWTIKLSPSDTDASAIFSKDVAGGSSGVIDLSNYTGTKNDNVTLIPAGTYYYDIKIWNASNFRSNLIAGTLVISQSTTQRAIP